MATSSWAASAAPLRATTATGPGRVRTFFDLDNAWERPRPAGYQRTDLIITASMWVFGLLTTELARSIGAFPPDTTSALVPHAVVAGAVLPLVARRRYPLATLLIVNGYMLAASTLAPVIGSQLIVQAAAFTALFSGVAWARNRRQMAAATIAVVLAFIAWMAYFLIASSLVSEAFGEMNGTPRQGLVSPVVATVIFTVLLNGSYLAVAVVGGQLSWRAAHRESVVAAQAAYIVDQAEMHREAALVEERLRIARELHDVVAHHVSVIGVQAAAARKVLDRDPPAAAQALTVVEESARQAVREMRTLLGTLRSPGRPRVDQDRAASASGTAGLPGAPDGRAQAPAAAPPHNSGRGPEPGLADIPALVQATTGDRFEVGYTLVEDPPGAALTVPPAVALSLYRTVQESLANVRRHSTATSVSVTVRVAPRDQAAYAEAEILDAGRPRGSTSGSGLGLLGIRERVDGLGGTAEIGPRPTGGYRVRVRFPLAGDPGVPV